MQCPIEGLIHDHHCPMDPSPVHNTPPVVEEEDEWDTDGFVIPSLGIEYQERNKTEAPEAETSKPLSPNKDKEEENIYLRPHGAPPQPKQQEANTFSRKQRFKQKLKEADRKVSGTGRENKLENLRELVGAGKVSGSMSKSSPRDWLDPHCHESQFEKWYLQ